MVLRQSRHLLYARVYPCDDCDSWYCGSINHLCSTDLKFLLFAAVDASFAFQWSYCHCSGPWRSLDWLSFMMKSGFDMMPIRFLIFCLFKLRHSNRLFLLWNVSSTMGIWIVLHVSPGSCNSMLPVSLIVRLDASLNVMDIPCFSKSLMMELVRYPSRASCDTAWTWRSTWNESFSLTTLLSLQLPKTSLTRLLSPSYLSRLSFLKLPKSPCWCCFCCFWFQAFCPTTTTGSSTCSTILSETRSGYTTFATSMISPWFVDEARRQLARQCVAALVSGERASPLQLSPPQSGAPARHAARTGSHQCGTHRGNLLSFVTARVLEHLDQDAWPVIGNDLLHLGDGNFDDLLNYTIGNSFLRNELYHLPNVLPNLWNWHVNLLFCVLLPTLLRQFPTWTHVAHLFAREFPQVLRLVQIQLRLFSLLHRGNQLLPHLLQVVSEAVNTLLSSSHLRDDRPLLVPVLLAALRRRLGY